MNKSKRQLIQKAIDLLEQARQEEENARNNLPESLQMSDRANNMDENVDQLQMAIDEATFVLER